MIFTECAFFDGALLLQELPPGQRFRLSQSGLVELFGREPRSLWKREDHVRTPHLVHAAAEEHEGDHFQWE